VTIIIIIIIYQPTAGSVASWKNNKQLCVEGKARSRTKLLAIAHIINGE